MSREPQTQLARLSEAMRLERLEALGITFVPRCRCDPPRVPRVWDLSAQPGKRDWTTIVALLAGAMVQAAHMLWGRR